MLDCQTYDRLAILPVCRVRIAKQFCARSIFDAALRRVRALGKPDFGGGRVPPDWGPALINVPALADLLAGYEGSDYVARTEKVGGF